MQKVVKNQETEPVAESARGFTVYKLIPVIPGFAVGKLDELNGLERRGQQGGVG